MRVATPAEQTGRQSVSQSAKEATDRFRRLNLNTRFPIAKVDLVVLVVSERRWFSVDC